MQLRKERQEQEQERLEREAEIETLKHRALVAKYTLQAADAEAELEDLQEPPQQQQQQQDPLLGMGMALLSGFLGGGKNGQPATTSTGSTRQIESDRETVIDDGDGTTQALEAEVKKKKR